jgi:hypothetical protein
MYDLRTCFRKTQSGGSVSQLHPKSLILLTLFTPIFPSTARADSVTLEMQPSCACSVSAPTGEIRDIRGEKLKVRLKGDEVVVNGLEYERVISVHAPIERALIYTTSLYFAGGHLGENVSLLIQTDKKEVYRFILRSHIPLTSGGYHSTSNVVQKGEKLQIPGLTGIYRVGYPGWGNSTSGLRRRMREGFLVTYGARIRYYDEEFRPGFWNNTNTVISNSQITSTNVGPLRQDRITVNPTGESFEPKEDSSGTVQVFRIVQTLSDE